MPLDIVVVPTISLKSKKDKKKLKKASKDCQECQEPVCAVAAPLPSADCRSTSPAAVSPLLQIVGQVHTDVLADVLLFAEVQTLGSFAAVCKETRDCTWDDLHFLKAYAGPNFAEPANCGSLSPTVMRDAVRQFAYGLEGQWGTAFADFAAIRHHIDVFGEASYMISGLQQQDDELELTCFIDALAEQLEKCDTSCERTRTAAEAVIQKVQGRADFFSDSTVAKLEDALRASLKRAEKQKFADIWGPSLYEQDDNEEETMWSPAQDDQCLSQSFLSIMNSHVRD